MKWSVDGPIPSTFRCLLCTAKVSLEMSLDCSLGCIKSFWAKKEKNTWANLEKIEKDQNPRYEQLFPDELFTQLGIIQVFMQ